MDLTTTRTMDVTKLALDGLLMRQRAIAANTANVMSPNYSRKEVHFENQLQEIINHDNLKDYMKTRNSIEYNPSALDLAMGREKPELTPQQKRYLDTDIKTNYEPQVIDDVVSGSDSQGNNVELEKEIMDMAETGLKYNVLTRLEGKSVKTIMSAIKGDYVG